MKKWPNMAEEVAFFAALIRPERGRRWKKEGETSRCPVMRKKYESTK